MCLASQLHVITAFAIRRKTRNVIQNNPQYRYLKTLACPTPRQSPLASRFLLLAHLSHQPPFLHPTDEDLSVGTPDLHPTDEDLSVGTPDLHPTDEDLSVGTPDQEHPGLVQIQAVKDLPVAIRARG